MLGAEIRGLVELHQKFAQVAEDLHGGEMLDGMRKATMWVTTDAKRLAPASEGRLRSSITPEIQVQGLNVIGVVGTNVLYAPYQETGTKPFWPPISALETWARRHGINPYVVARAISIHGIKPKRYMQRAFDQNKARIVALIDDVVGEIVDK